MGGHHAGAGAQTVLVVDDDLGVRLIVPRMLEDQRYTVRIAPSASVALLILAAEPTDIDLVVTDVRMPGMSGVELAAEVLRRWPAIPVGLMSAHEPEELSSSHRELARLPFLRKPFTSQTLVGFLEALAAPARWGSADPVGPA